MLYATDALLVALGLIPSLVWMIFFYHQDCHPEPKYLITKTFLMGIIIAPLAVFLQWGFENFIHGSSLGLINYFLADGSLFFLWAAFVEEFVKYYAVRIIALHDAAFDEPVDAMVYMMMAGLGFAAIENILYLFSAIHNGIQTTLVVWALRSVGSTLLHALSSGLVGYFLALSWFFQHHRRKLLFTGLVIATLFHFTFNLFLAAADNELRGLLLSVGLLCVMAFLVFLLFDKIKKRSHGVAPRLTVATEKEISVT